MTTQSKGKALAKAAVMQPKYRTQVVQSRKAYRRKSAKAATQKTLQSEGFVVMGRPQSQTPFRPVDVSSEPYQRPDLLLAGLHDTTNAPVARWSRG